MTETDAQALAPGWQREARRALHALVEAEGQPYGPMVYEPTGPHGECWTNAYRAALATGRTYVEGTVVRAGVTEAHAFTVEPSGIVHEHTEGYAHAGGYRGIPISVTPDSEAADIVAQVYGDDQHTSMVEGLLTVGVPRHVILARLRDGL